MDHQKLLQEQELESFIATIVSFILSWATVIHRFGDVYATIWLLVQDDYWLR